MKPNAFVNKVDTANRILGDVLKALEDLEACGYRDEFCNEAAQRIKDALGKVQGVQDAANDFRRNMCALENNEHIKQIQQGIDEAAEKVNAIACWLKEHVTPHLEPIIGLLQEVGMRSNVWRPKLKAHRRRQRGVRDGQPIPRCVPAHLLPSSSPALHAPACQD